MSLLLGCRDDFFLKSSETYEPCPSNISGGNPQPRIFIDKKQLPAVDFENLRRAA